MILNYQTYNIIKESIDDVNDFHNNYTIRDNIKNAPFKKYTRDTSKTLNTFNSENSDLYKYIYKQKLDKITKTISGQKYNVNYNIILTKNAIDCITDLNISNDDVYDYVELAIPYISKSLISNPNFNYNKENLFYFEGESLAFGFVLNMKNVTTETDIQINNISEPIINIIITRVSTPEDENGVVYVHTSGDYAKLNV